MASDHEPDPAEAALEAAKAEHAEVEVRKAVFREAQERRERPQVRSKSPSEERLEDSRSSHQAAG